MRILPSTALAFLLLMQSLLLFTRCSGLSLVVRRSKTFLLMAKKSSSVASSVATEEATSNGRLDVGLENVKGIGPKTVELLQQLDITTVRDLLFHFPTKIVDRSELNTHALSDSLIGSIVSLVVVVESVKEGFGGAPHSVLCRTTHEEQKRLGLTFFFGKTSFAYSPWMGMKSKFFVGNTLVVSGKLSRSTFSREFELVNPDVCIEMSNTKGIEKALVVEPIYSLTNGLTLAKMKGLVGSALQRANETILEDYLPPSFLKQKGWPSILEALEAAHAPKSLESLALTSVWRERLAFDELVLLQVLQIEKEKAKREQLGAEQRSTKAYVCTGTGVMTTTLEASLPFALTQCQRNAIEEIKADLAKPERMVRLVQGDVGSGKTLVTIMALLATIEKGTHQSALLAPTEILAHQHFQTISKYLEVIRNNAASSEGVVQKHARPNVRLITSSVKGKAREQLLQDIEQGLVDIVVGTHALLSEPVANSFPNLGLVCIDEEQRFGTQQKATLADRANVMYTTATPIPRSLMLLVQQGYAVSTLREKPPTKRPVQTVLIGTSLTDKVIERIKANIPYGSKVFWVTPTLTPSEALKGSSTQERFEQLNAIFPGRVAQLHGRMSSEEKESVMARFASKDADVSVLVSTTVVEVGVDIPDASICVVDRAEHFGLSSIHQIRGRVGRGEKPTREILNECFCVLLYNDSDTIDAQGQRGEPQTPVEKLQILASSNDGFEIAEYDLKMRGPGDIFGLKQHGEAQYKAACLTAHLHLLTEALSMASHVTSSSSASSLSILRQLYSPKNAVMPAKKTPAIIAPLAPLTPLDILAPPHKVAEKVASTTSFLSDASKIVVLDLETTGLKIQENRIIQISATVLLGAEHGPVFNAYVLPAMQHEILEKKMSKDIEPLTGISFRFLQDEGITFKEAWTNFQKWLQQHCGGTQNVCLIAHNGKSFDFPFLAEELNRNKLTSLSSFGFVYIDSLQLFRDPSVWRVFASSKPKSFKFDVLYSTVLGKEHVGAHNAVSDVLALAELLSHSALEKAWRNSAAVSRQTRLSDNDD